MASRMTDGQNKIVEILQTITVLNSYHYDVTKVSKKWIPVDKVDKFPTYSVMRGPWSTKWVDEAKILKRTKCGFAITGYGKLVEADTANTGTLAELLDNVQEDAIEAIWRNENAILQSADLEEIIVEAGEGLAVEEESWGFITVYVTIIFTHEDNV